MKNRLYGIDLLRTLALFAVLHFHALEEVFSEKEQIFPKEVSISGWIEYYSRALSMSGNFLLFIFAFLFGWQNRSRIRNLLFLAVGIPLLALAESRPFLRSFTYEWDIYSFILVASVFTELCRRTKIPSWVYVLVGVVVQLVPWANLFPVQDNLVYEMLIGSCPPEGSGIYPLLPWLGFFLFAFGLGRWCKQAAFVQTLKPLEVGVWIVALAAGFPWLGAYYHTPIDEGFYCYILRQPMTVFWAHLAWFLFFMRLSLLSSVNEFLGRQQWMIWLSQRQWNLHFGLFYLLQFGAFAILSLFRQQYMVMPRLFDCGLILSVLICEYVAARLTRTRSAVVR